VGNWRKPVTSQGYAQVAARTITGSCFISKPLWLTARAKKQQIQVPTFLTNPVF
jgi:hypothetical protein